jgi:hypothetical protein
MNEATGAAVAAAAAAAAADESNARGAASAQQALVALGADLWTLREAAALEDFRSRLPQLRAHLACGSGDSGVLLLAALGPAFWMVGQPTEGYEMVARLAQAAEVEPAPWEELCAHADGAGAAAAVAVAAVVPPVATAGAGGASSDGDGGDGERATAHDSPPPAPLAALAPELQLALALDGAGANAYAATRYDDAAAMHARALTLADAACDACGRGGGTAAAAAAAAVAAAADANALRSRALDGLGRVAREQGRYMRSLALHAHAVAAAEAARGAALVRPAWRCLAANAWSNSGVAAYRLGEAALAQRLHAEAQRLRAGLGDLRGTSCSLGNLALLAAEAGDTAAALAQYGASLELRVRLGDTWGVAGSQRAMAHLLWRRAAEGDAERAVELLGKALPGFGAVGDSLGVSECCETLALALLLLRGEGEAAPVAARLLGVAVGVRKRIGAATEMVESHADERALRAREAPSWDQGLREGESDELERTVARIAAATA